MNNKKHIQKIDTCHYSGLPSVMSYIENSKDGNIHNNRDSKSTTKKINVRGRKNN